MKVLYILFGVLFWLLCVSGRHLSEDDAEKSISDPTANQLRHRRRPRQSFYDYNNRDYRRGYSRLQDEAFDEILGYLQEIAREMRRTPPPPPPPPQPIYIPYSVPYYVPQHLNCNNKANDSSIPDFPKRGLFPTGNGEDRLIFGVVPETVDKDDSDGSSPINLDPRPTNVNLNDLPKVDHGTIQAGAEEPKTETPKPGLCKAAILTCCNFKNPEQRACFMKYNCVKTYSTGLACRPDVIKRVLEEFAKAYGPTNRL